MEIMHITNDNFESEVRQAAGPVLADFYADWCGPCKMLAPIVEEIARERPDLKVVKINVDEADAVAAEFGIMSIPTLILFRDGKAEAKMVGFQSKERLIQTLGL